MLTRLMRARPIVTRQVRLFSATAEAKAPAPKVDAFDRMTGEWVSRRA